MLLIICAICFDAVICVICNFLFLYMYKLKSSRAITKRLKVTATNKYLRRQASRSHLLQKKASRRKQRLRRVMKLKCADYVLLKFKIL